MTAGSGKEQVTGAMGDAREVVIERLGREGDGIAGALRIPGALPGETWAMPTPGGDATLLAASPVRNSPPCPHFGTCGGCSLQHASDAFLAEWKAEIIGRALLAHGLEADILPTRSSPPRSRRRATLAGRRTKKGALVGFHARQSEEIVPIESCHVVLPEIVAALPVLGRITRLAAPRARAIRLQITQGPAGLDLDLGGAKPLDGTARAGLADLARETGLARLSLAGEPLFQDRPPFHELGEIRVTPPPGAFLQATAEGEAALVEAVTATCRGASTIVDLFAGCGTFALPLAREAQVHAVEGEGAMLQALDRAWRQARGLKRITTEARDLFRRPLLADELKRFEAVVLDPPRAGAEAQVREISVSRAGRVAYVSCEPASFARDAAILVSAGFRLDHVLPVDQFLWSGHVELAADFSR